MRSTIPQRSPSIGRKLAALLAAGILLATLVPMTATAASTRIGFGFPAKQAQEFVNDAGSGTVAYATMWAGAWHQKQATPFGDIKSDIRLAKAAGAIPIIHWWYWGDESGNVACYSNASGGGCWDDKQEVWKTMAKWNELTIKLADAIRAEAASGQAIVVVETEFNKGGRINGDEYDDQITSLLQWRIDYFQSRGIKAMLSLGSWDQGNWYRFRNAVESSDYVGTMSLRSCVRNSGTYQNYSNAAEDIVKDVGKLKQLFPTKAGGALMQVIVPDFGLSTYNCNAGDDYQARQRDEIVQLRSLLPRLKENDTVGFVFRSVVDVTMDPANHHGAAESFWGFKEKTAGHPWKKAYPDVLALVQSEMRPNAPPTASFTKSCSGLACSFDGRGSSDSDGAVVAWTWRWGDGSADGTGSTPSHTYAAAGTYTVTLTVRDDDGATAQTSQQVSVAAGGNQAPTASFAKSCSGLSCSFDGGASSDPDGTVSSYAWTFGDGSTGSGRTASRTYAAAGTYTVTLTVTDNAGATGSTSQQVTVSASGSNPALPGSREAEDFASRPVGGLYTNAAWSGGKGWNIWTTGGIEQPFSNPASTRYRFTVKAAGDLAGPDPPRMVLKANGAVIGQWDVASSSLLSYSADATLAAGDVTLRIEFTNDYLQSGQDRNLRVDVLTAATLSQSMPATVEAEDFASRPVGGLYTNAAWSGGKGWNIWTAGGIEHTLNNPAQATYKFTIKAAGDLAGPDPPRMVLRANGVIVQQWDVVSSSLWPYYAEAALAPGDVTLRIEFTNDYSGVEGDRNLRVDVMQVETVAPALPGSFEAESFDFKSTGGLVTNAAWSGGKGWNIWTNGHIEERTNNPSARSYQITIKAAADLAGPDPPRMVLRANGAVVHQWDVVSSSLWPYSVTANLPAGDVTFRIEFTNDYNLNGEDRNLKVDVLTLT